MEKKNDTHTHLLKKKSLRFQVFRSWSILASALIPHHRIIMGNGEELML